MTQSISNQAFQLKGGLFTLTVMQLKQDDLAAFQQQLLETLSQAPKFFDYAPIVMDLNDFQTQNPQFELRHFIEVMRAAQLVPFGIRGGSQMMEQQARALGLAVLNNSGTQPIPSSHNESKSTDSKQTLNKTQDSEPTIENVSFSSSKVITQPVRSGQQIYAKNTDLIILSSVSHGAEVLADGHIHIYGPLRGRALAGIMGNTEAKIFCKSMDAELISIAGRYLVNEQLEQYKNEEDLHIFLEDEHLKFGNFS